MFFNANLNGNFSKKLLCGASLAALATTFAAPANAQEGIETVVVTGTGSLIKGINPVGSNLVTIDTETMRQGGALTANQILEQVPQLANMFNNNVAAPTAGNFSGFRPQLRSLPSQNIVGGSATLVLMDGQNLVGVSALGTAPDAGVVPTVVLQRVDVLPDGASATYGANAITGVINFITRDRFDGLQLEADVGVADHYSAFHGSVMGGTSWAGGSAYIALEHTDNTPLLGKDRSYTRQNLTDIGGRDSRGSACPLPNITIGANNYAQIGYPTNTPGSLRANVSGPFPNANATTNASSFNRCDTNGNTSTYPSLNQTGIFGSVRQEISDGIVFDMKMVWNSRFQYSVGPQSGSTQTITTSNPYFQSIQGETSQRVQFDFSPYLKKDWRRTNNGVQVFQVSPRLNVALPFKDWSLTVLGNYGRSFTDTHSPELGINTSLLATAISTGIGGNFFNPYNLGLTPGGLMGQIISQGSVTGASQHLMQGQASIDGSLFALPGGEVKAALGAKYSWEDFNAKRLTFGVIDYSKLHRVSKAVFGQVNVPLIGEDNRMPLAYSLALDVSGRIDDYSDFGNTSNYKLGFSWQPIEEFTLRGTKGTSFNAPSLADTSAPDGRYQLTLYTSPNPYVPPGTSLADSLRPSILVPGGNPHLTPELGSTWSIGGDLRPQHLGSMDLTGLEMGVTYYHISISNQIGLLFNNLQEFVVPNYRSLYIINPSVAQAAPYGYTNLTNFPGTTLASAWGTSPAGGGPLDPFILYDARRNNLGAAQLAGLDFNAKYASDFDFGNLSFGFSGTYSLQNGTAATSAGPFLSIQSNTVPLYAVSAFAQLITGPWNIRGSLNFTPSFKVDPATQAYTLYGQRRIDSFTTVNLHVGYDLTDVTSWTNDMEVGVTINNLFDQDPPIYLHGGPNLPANSGIGIIASGGTLGRYMLLSLQKKF